MGSALKFWESRRSAGLWLIAVGILTVQASQAFSAPPEAAAKDVILRAQGTLLGQVVSSHGVPAPNVAVTVRAQGKELATGITNRQGFFAFSGLRSGVYELTTARGGACFRTWDAGIAPPGVQPGAMVVVSEHSDRTVRGQGFAGTTRLTTILAAAGGAGIIAAGTMELYDNQRGEASSE